jgi:hypothetical protein
MYCLPGKHYRDSAAVSLYLPARQHSTQRNQQRTNSQRAIYFFRAGPFSGDGPRNGIRLFRSYTVHGNSRKPKNSSICTYSMYYETRTTPENWHWIFSAGHRKCFFHYLAKFCIFFLVFVSYRMNAEGTRRK